MFYLENNDVLKFRTEKPEDFLKRILGKAILIEDNWQILLKTKIGKTELQLWV